MNLSQNNSKEGLNRNRSIIRRIMAKIQDYISTFLSLIGIYLILIYFGLFEYSEGIKAIISGKGGLLFFGLFLLLFSYIISPILWERILNKIKR
ncbi:hypothetical protein HYT57_04780 [Candidatus Woesearchaeota archaeon]|nr:hypothetical protein [Candidatus Woesearchaeota archaeon]